MKAGDKVRLKDNPSRTGTLTGEEKTRGGKKTLQVRFPDREDFYREGALELMPKQMSVYDCLKAGRYGRLSDLRWSLTYARLSGKLANLIYSMDTTNTEFYAYQFKPLLRFLESPNHGILIADEVGLGKTIEAGLIWTEWRSRNEARRLLVVCPAILREKWKTELLERFGVNANICSAQEILDIIQRYKNGGTNEFAIITSIQGIRPPRNWEEEENAPQASAELVRLLSQLETEDPIFDLTIIDEAHYLRNPESQTSKLGGLLRAVSDGIVLLSATPIQLRSEDLFHQVKHLDEVSFDRLYSFEWILEASKPLVKIKDLILQGKATPDVLKSQLEEAKKYHGLRESKQIIYILDNIPSASELLDRNYCSQLADTIDRINPLSHVISRTRKRDIQERRITRKPISLPVAMQPVEENFYKAVTQRVRSFCQGLDLPTGFILTTPQRQMTSSMAAACRGWLKKQDSTQDEEFNFEALGIDEETGFLVNKKSQIGVLTKELIEIARDLGGDYESLRQNDSKYRTLWQNMQKYWLQYPHKKIILFAFYRETLDYLFERVTEEGIRAIVLRGGMDKHRALQQFKDPDGPRLLLASEVASEGVDLQFCSLLINYDLPWNPQRIEQRIGRIDRIGQQENSIIIWSIFHENTLDDRVYDRLLSRLNIFEESLGCIESILGENIRQMTHELFSHDLTPEQEIRVIEQTMQAIANRSVQEENLEEQATHLVAHGDYIQNKVNAIRELKRYISADDLYHYVHDFLDDKYPGCRFVRLSGEGLIFKIELSMEAKNAFSDFVRQARIQEKSRLHLDSSKIRFRFENKVFIGDSNDELISQFHPLVLFVNKNCQSLEQRNCLPTVGIEISVLELPERSPGLYVFCVQSWSLRAVLRDIEQLAYMVFSIHEKCFLDKDEAERLINTSVHRGQDWLSAGNEVRTYDIEDFYEECEERLDECYNEFVRRLENENEDRLSFQISNLEQNLRKKQGDWQAKISEMRNKGKDKGSRLWEAKLQKLQQRTQEKIVKIQNDRKATHEYKLVSSGVIKIF